MLTYEINNFFQFSKIGPDTYYTIILAMKNKKMGGGEGESVSIPSHTHMCNTQVNTKTHLEGSGSAEMLYIQCS